LIDTRIKNVLSGDINRNLVIFDSIP